jgi:CheY-like chemotaxis protein
MSKAILAVVDDLFFLSKIQQTAQRIGVTVETVAPAELAGRAAEGAPGGVLVDLNHRSGASVEAVRALKASAAGERVPVVGFFSHVQEELGRAARQAGCDRVMARSAFATQLPRLLAELAGSEPPPEPERNEL